LENSLFDREELSLNKRIQQRGCLNRNISSLVLFLIVFIISTGINVITELFETRQKKLMAESEKTKAELAFLKSQVNPHFLFNTLYSIYYLTLNKSDDAPEAVMKLSDIMRFVFAQLQEEAKSDPKIRKAIDRIVSGDVPVTLVRKSDEDMGSSNVNRVAIKPLIPEDESQRTNKYAYEKVNFYIFRVCLDHKI